MFLYFIIRIYYTFYFSPVSCLCHFYSFYSLSFLGVLPRALEKHNTRDGIPAYAEEIRV